MDRRPSPDEVPTGSRRLSHLNHLNHPKNTQSQSQTTATSDRIAQSLINQKPRPSSWSPLAVRVAMHHRDGLPDADRPGGNLIRCSVSPPPPISSPPPKIRKSVGNAFWRPAAAHNGRQAPPKHASTGPGPPVRDMVPHLLHIHTQDASPRWARRALATRVAAKLSCARPAACRLAAAAAAKSGHAYGMRCASKECGAVAQ